MASKAAREAYPGNEFSHPGVIEVFREAFDKGVEYALNEIVSYIGKGSITAENLIENFKKENN